MLSQAEHAIAPGAATATAAGAHASTECGAETRADPRRTDVLQLTWS